MPFAPSSVLVKLMFYVTPQDAARVRVILMPVHAVGFRRAYFLKQSFRFLLEARSKDATGGSWHRY